MQVAELAAMLHVDDQEVEAGAPENLGDRWIGNRHPGADNRLAGLDPLLEGDRSGKHLPAFAVAQSLAFSH